MSRSDYLLEISNVEIVKKCPTHVQELLYSVHDYRCPRIVILIGLHDGSVHASKLKER